jgi:hypothetical protein
MQSLAKSFECGVMTICGYVENTVPRLSRSALDDSRNRRH